MIYLIIGAFILGAYFPLLTLYALVLYGLDIILLTTGYNVPSVSFVVIFYGIISIFMTARFLAACVGKENVTFTRFFK